MSTFNLTPSYLGYTWQATSLTSLAYETYCRVNLDGVWDTTSQPIASYATSSVSQLREKDAGGYLAQCYRYKSSDDSLLGQVGVNTDLIVPVQVPTAPISLVSPYRFEDEYGAGLMVGWGSAHQADLYQIKAVYSGGTIYYNSDGTETSGPLQQMLYSTSYTLSVQALIDAGGGSYYGSEFTSTSIATTAPQIPTISQSTVDSSSIKINTGAITGAYDEIQVSIYTNSYTLISTQNCAESSNTTFTGLSQYTTYKVRARTMSTISGTALYSAYTSYLTITTLGALVPFVWSPTIVQGGTIGITASQFLLFQIAINECRRAYGLANYSFTTSATYVASGKSIFAFLYVQCATAIDDINGQVTNTLKDTVSGDDVTAYHWTNITTALNNAINAL